MPASLESGTSTGTKHLKPLMAEVILVATGVPLRSTTATWITPYLDELLLDQGKRALEHRDQATQVHLVLALAIQDRQYRANRLLLPDITNLGQPGSFGKDDLGYLQGLGLAGKL